MPTSPSDVPTVLVLGATGLVGARVAARLAAGGVRVSGLVRHPGQGRPVPGVELRAGDALDPAALAEAVRGCQAVCLCLPWELEVAAAQALTRACAGTRTHVVYVSGLTITPANAGDPMVDAKLRAEAVLAEAGLPLTVFKPSWFLDALPRFVQGGRATLFGRPALPYRLVALEDFAGLVARAVASPPAGRQVVVVEGPEAVALPDALQAYCDAVHPGLQAKVLPVWVGRALGWLSRDAGLRSAVALLAYFARVVQVSPEPPVLTPTGLDAWLAALPRPAPVAGAAVPQA